MKNFTDVKDAIEWAQEHGAATIVDRHGVACAHVSIPRDEILPNDVDEWKARAEKAEAEVRRWERLEKLRWDAGAVPHEVAARFAKHALRYRRLRQHDWEAFRVLCLNAEKRAERAEAGLAMHQKLFLDPVIADRDGAIERAELAEALLREAPVKHDAQCFSPDGCRCNLVFWRAKVWDLLEGKT